MQTRCPSCETIFRLSEDETSISAGMVQCGVCGHFFNALKNQDPGARQHPYSKEDLLVNKSRSLAVGDVTSSIARSAAAFKPAAPWWNTLLWTMLILLALIGVLLQLTWFHRERLLLQPEFKPVLEQVCSHIDCQLQPKIDVENIELLSRDVRSHPTHHSALLITATFINRAEFEQPYPDVGLILSDLSGNVIAQRQFKPEEYLPEDTRPADLMVREVPVTMVMEVQDPGSETVSFRFEFL